jgi:hypothetical protein
MGETMAVLERRLSWAACAAALVALAALVACSSESDGVDSNDPLPPPAEGEGYQIEMTATAPPGSEIWKCVVQRLPNDDWMFVNHVESVQTLGMHHMDVMVIGFAGVELDPGTYECDDLYRENSDLMDGLILYASQDDVQEIQLPPGIAANLPPNLMIMYEIHYVNTTEQPVDTFSKINMYDYDPTLVTDTIWGAAIRDTELNIPAMSEHTEWTRCVMTDPIDLLFLTSHTHQLGREVTIRSFDGQTVGDEIYRNTDWQTPFLQSFGTQAMHIPAGSGFEFSCRFDNRSADPVTWGFGAADEMCQIGIVFSPGEAKRKCTIVETSDGLGVQ